MRSDVAWRYSSALVEIRWSVKVTHEFFASADDSIEEEPMLKVSVMAS